MKSLLLAATLLCTASALVGQALPTLPPDANALPQSDARPHSHPMIPADAPPPSATFINPLLQTGPDPWVVYWHGFYYYSNSPGKNLFLIKTRDITDLRHGERKVVWTPEPGHPWSYNIWAPELHRWGGKWYLYFAADDAPDHNAGHRIFVIENPSDDPTEGTWTFKGQVSKPDDRWAIDVTVFEHAGQHYMVWAGWQGPTDGEQDLYIAHMANPWTLDTNRVLISKPELAWETHGNLPGRHVNVNEGPEFLEHGSHMFLIFSASGCWTDFYTLGALEADSSADPMNPRSWHKIDHPFLSTD
jgi:GH43 family beta-xylosidase